MKKNVILGMIVLFALFLPACSMSKVVWENMSQFTVAGNKAQIQYRPWNQPNYQNLASDYQKVDSYSWIKTLDSEAVLDFKEKGQLLMDKNSIVQVRLTTKGVYVVQIKGNTFHHVAKLAADQYYNVETSRNKAAVLGTEFGVDGAAGYWVEGGGQVVISDEITERHEDMSEEDVPDGPLWVYGGQRTVIIIPGQRGGQTPGDLSGNNGGTDDVRVSPGEESNVDSDAGRSRVTTSDPNTFTGTTWRARARELNRRLRELDNRRSELGEDEYWRQVLGLINAYAATLPDNINTADELDCNGIRNFTIPHAMPAIEELKSNPDSLAAGDMAFADFGGVNGVENFLNHVCDDEVIDAEERDFINRMGQLIGY